MEKKFAFGIAEGFLAAKREGKTTLAAAKVAGVHRSTVYAWLAQGQAAREVRSQGFALTPAQEALAGFVGAFETAVAQSDAERANARLEAATALRTEEKRARHGDETIA